MSAICFQWNLLCSPSKRPTSHRFPQPIVIDFVTKKSKTCHHQDCYCKKGTIEYPPLHEMLWLGWSFQEDNVYFPNSHRLFLVPRGLLVHALSPSFVCQRKPLQIDSICSTNIVLTAHSLSPALTQLRFLLFGKQGSGDEATEMWG